MVDLKTVFDRIQKNKSRVREIKSLLRDAYAQVPEHEEVVDKRKALGERMKQIRASVEEGYTKEVTELEDLLVDIASDKEMLNDIVLTKFTKGEKVVVENAFQQQMLPIFSVRFVKEK